MPIVRCPFCLEYGFVLSAGGPAKRSCSNCGQTYWTREGAGGSGLEPVRPAEQTKERALDGTDEGSGQITLS